MRIKFIAFFGIFLVTFGAMFYATPIVAEDNADTYLSEDIQMACVEIGEQYNICPELLEALIERESSGNQYAENGSCKGLCQISKKWHTDRMERLHIDDIYDVWGNITLCADYLTELADKYEDVAVCLAIYHGESNAVSKIEAGHLSGYVRGILERSAELEQIHGK